MNTETGAIEFENGIKINADLIVAADGIRVSLCQSPRLVDFIAESLTLFI